MKNNTIWTVVIIVVLVILGIILLSSKPEVTPGEDVLPEGGEEIVIPEEEGGEFLPEGGEEAIEALEEAEAVIPEGSPVSEEGEVLTPAGEIVDNTALPGSPDAPKQSRSLSDAEVPEKAIQLTVSASGFVPNEFDVKSGDVVTLSVTSADRTHVFKFDDASLQGVAIGVAGNETRAITFKAPVKGDYTFYCDVPGHRGRGETGVMHVK